MGGRRQAESHHSRAADAGRPQRRVGQPPDRAFSSQGARILDATGTGTLDRRRFRDALDAEKNRTFVFPEATDDPWQHILAEQTPRPAFVKFAKECLDQIAKGKAKPLELDQL